jgi:hypothetical protein
MKIYLTEALQSLRPGAEFSYTNDDYSTINWVVLEGKAPTLAEVNKEIERIKKLEIEEPALKAAAKAALLERLGITAEEASLLLS